MRPAPSDPHRRPQGPPRPERLASVTRLERDGVTVATVFGEIDVSNAAEIGGQLSEISNRALGLVVDLGQVGHLDSTGIALLYELHVRLRRRGQSLVVVAPAGSAARRVLELTAFDTRATVANELDAALIAARSIVPGDPPSPGDLP
jgi:anti-sigma B factor antagonist